VQRLRGVVQNQYRRHAGTRPFNPLKSEKYKTHQG
jgi:hypothetical protein